MPENVKKTKSALRPNETPFQGFSSRRARNKSDARAALPGLLIITVGLLILIVGIFILNNYKDKCDDTKIGEGCFQLEVADDSNEHAKGLSNRESLAENGGMIFYFDEARNVCMWMKDTKMNLDIIWLNESKKITRIEKNLSPETYPKNYCQQNTKYVIELNPFSTDKYKINVGDYVKF